MSFSSRAPSPPPTTALLSASPFMPRSRHISTTSTSSGLRKMESRESLFSKRDEGAEKEINIQVVLRCRGRNEREIRENSQVIVETIPQRKEVRTPARTYTFDRVFGPDASQQYLYDEIVQPILDEVLMGYNCTIFAYGQTGTGKTYTMEGDLSQIDDRMPGANSGIIHRTLHQLFLSLEATSTEYSVRVSSIELYNEELNDLLGSETDSKKLKIFEDVRGKGVLIQGLEEVLVKSAIDGVRVLQQGSKMRQIAATKCNEKSSRSHCVYTITVHIKEATPDGEDLLKVGKLNLVDLAGSENIQRSGAENKRAREAGMINQSLLTLGRVINALVEHSPHVPYRESKLTRLLQDSLGGRTKTCIIATISPAKMNLEETISTLEYASRAKNIRNKPEVNQRMTKKALIKEYISEIERLKSDLSATREKNGIFLSSDSYAKLTQENNANRTSLDEERRRIQALEEELGLMNEKYQQYMEMYSDIKLKYEWTNNELARRNQDLEKQKALLDLTKNELLEQKMLRRAHTWTELKLDGLANDLVGSYKESVSDVDGLFDSLEHKNKIENYNSISFGELQQALLSKANELGNQTLEFKEQMNELANSTDKKMAEFCEMKEKEIIEAHAFIDSKLQQLLTDQSSLGLATKEQGNSFASFRDQITQLRIEFNETMTSRYTNSHQFFGEIFDELRKDMEGHYQQIQSYHQNLGKSLADLIASTQTHLDVQTQSIQQMGSITTSTVELETSRIQGQTAYLTTLLDQERAKSAQLKDELLGNISSLLSSFTENQDRSLRDAIAVTQNSLDKNVEVLKQFSKEYRELEDGVIGKNSEAKKVVTKGGENIGAEMDEYLKMSRQQLESAHGKNENMKKRVFEDMENSNGIMQSYSKRTSEVTTEATEVYTTIEQQQTQTLSTLVTNAQDGFGRLGSFVGKLNEDVRGHTASMKEAVVLTRNATESFYDAISKELEQTRAEITMSDRLKIDTSAKPQRRNYKFPHKWALTRQHNDLLCEFREKGFVRQTFNCEEEEEVITVDSDPSSAIPTPSTSASSIRSRNSMENIDPTVAVPLLPSPALAKDVNPLDELRNPSPTFAVPMVAQQPESNSRLPRFSRPKRLKASKDIDENRAPFFNVSNTRN